MAHQRVMLQNENEDSVDPTTDQDEQGSTTQRSLRRVVRSRQYNEDEGYATTTRTREIGKCVWSRKVTNKNEIVKTKRLENTTQVSKCISVFPANDNPSSFHTKCMGPMKNRNTFLQEPTKHKSVYNLIEEESPKKYGQSHSTKSSERGPINKLPVCKSTNTRMSIHADKLAVKSKEDKATKEIGTAAAVIDLATPNLTIPNSKNKLHPTTTPASGSKLISQEVPTEILGDGLVFTEGWIKKTRVRLGGSSAGHRDSYWISPIRKYSFRSIPEVRRFMRLLILFDGDEARAKQAFSKKPKKGNGNNANPNQHQKRIKRLFKEHESGRIFDFLFRYPALTKDQLSALLGKIALCNRSFNELKKLGYVEKVRGTRGAYYRLSDAAFLDPTKDRPKSNDAGMEELISALTGINGVKRRRGLTESTEKTVAVTKNRTKHTNRRKQNIEGSNDDLPCKRARRYTRPVASKTAVSAVLYNRDMIGNIMEYLDTNTLLFSMSAVSKNIHIQITHEHAVRCAMATTQGQRRMQQLADLIERCCIYTPSPMRILKLALGRRCEKCSATKTVNINNLGLFLCMSCRDNIVHEIKPHDDHAEMNPYILAAINDDRCASIVLGQSKVPRYLVYNDKEPYVDRSGELAGPLVSFAQLTASSGNPPSKTLDMMIESTRTSDLYRCRIPSILKACERFNYTASGEPLYNHLGIIDHKGSPYQPKKWMVLVLWENGERTWQPLSHFAEDDYESCQSYAIEHGLTDTTGWKRFRP